MARLVTKGAMALAVLSTMMGVHQMAHAEEAGNLSIEMTNTTEGEVANAPETTSSGTAATALVAAPEVSDPNQATEGQTVDVRILATTDLHTNLVNYDYYQDKPTEKLGLAKTAVLIDAARQENNNVVLLDNGDTIQGTPLGTYKAVVDPVKEGEQHPMYAALEVLNFDAATLGNHEFNYGLDYLNKVMKTANLPIVNANVLDAKTGQNLYKPFEILTKQFVDTKGQAINVKVGVTGIVPPQILNWDKANLEGIVVVQDSVEAIEAVVPKMREAGADLVIVLSHSGIGDDQYEKGEENVGYQIAGVKGVDAVITGHSHAEFPSGKGTGFYEKFAGVDGVKGLINGTPVVMAGKYGDHLGVIDLNIKYTDGRWQVVNSKGEIRKIDMNSDVAHQRVLEVAKPAHEKTIEYVRQQVGTTTAPITSYFALVKDDPSIQIVNNAQLWYAKKELAGTPDANLPILSAAAPFKAGTRGDSTAYTDIPAGPIAIKNVADLYLYDNVTAILKITGAQLKEWLEMSAGQFNTIDPKVTTPQELVNPSFRTYNFDVIDGVTYEIDVTQPNKYDHNGKLVNADANRIKVLRYNGQAVDPAQQFIVVTNNYRAYGQFPGVKDAEVKRLLNLENRQAIINYIIEEKTINPTADQNWTFADTIKGLDLRFSTAMKAQGLIGDAKDVVYLSEGENGFGNFQFMYLVKSAETPTPPAEVKPEQPTPPTVTPEKETSKAEVKPIAQPKVMQATPPTLPATGESDSVIHIVIGFVLAGVGAVVSRRKRS